MAGPHENESAGTAPATDGAAADPWAWFAQRPASTEWESISPDGCPPGAAWIWYKPAAVPHGAMLRIADEVRAQPAAAALITMRNLLQAAGINPWFVSMWLVNGAAFDSQQGASPLLDQPIPAPLPGADPSITVLIGPPMPAAPPTVPVAPAMPAPMPMPSAGAAPLPENCSASELLDRIESDWQAALEIEKELTRLRKQLVDMMTRLKSLNRELSPPERLHSNSQDKKDWLEARRWLRDASNRCSMLIKDYDIGSTSSAGQRTYFLQTYQQYVIKRIPFDGMEQAQRNFATYRKMCLSLQVNMGSAYSQAVQNAERAG